MIGLADSLGDDALRYRRLNFLGRRVTLDRYSGAAGAVSGQPIQKNILVVAHWESYDHLGAAQRCQRVQLVRENRGASNNRTPQIDSSAHSKLEYLGA